MLSADRISRSSLSSQRVNLNGVVDLPHLASAWDFFLLRTLTHYFDGKCELLCSVGKGELKDSAKSAWTSSTEAPERNKLYNFYGLRWALWSSRMWLWSWRKERKIVKEKNCVFRPGCNKKKEREGRWIKLRWEKCDNANASYNIIKYNKSRRAQIMAKHRADI